MYKCVKIFSTKSWGLVFEVEILSEQFGQFVNGQLVTYQDLTPGCRAAVVPTPATATTSVMEPGATAPQQHYSSRERGGGCVTDSWRCCHCQCSWHTVIRGRWRCVTWFFQRLPIQATQAEQLFCTLHSCSACVGWIGRRRKNQVTQHQRPRITVLYPLHGSRSLQLLLA